MIVSISKLKRDIKYLENVHQGLNKPMTDQENVGKIIDFYERIKHELETHGKAVILEGKYTQLNK